MKAVIQRVTEASVTVDGKCVSQIRAGLAVLLGVLEGDTQAEAEMLAKKIVGLRIFSDENGKINKSLKDVDGQLLLISQFTLYADCKKGNRPSFIRAGKPDKAEQLYEHVTERCRMYVPKVEHGIFGADMKVELVNDGPFTLALDSEELGFQ